MISNGSQIVSFEDSELGFAALELEALGDDAVLAFGKHATSILDSKFDLGSLPLLTEYKGVRVYTYNGFLPGISDFVCVFSVEEDDVGDRKIVLLFAQERFPLYVHRYSDEAVTCLWDGNDLAALKKDVVLPRAAAMFQ